MPTPILPVGTGPPLEQSVIPLPLNPLRWPPTIPLPRPGGVRGDQLRHRARLQDHLIIRGAEAVVNALAEPLTSHCS